MGDKTSSGSPSELGDAIKRGSALTKKDSRYTKIREMPTEELNDVLDVEDRKSLSEKRPSKGGPVSVAKLKIPIMPRRKQKGYRKSEICDELRNELDECLIHGVLL